MRRGTGTEFLHFPDPLLFLLVPLIGDTTKSTNITLIITHAQTVTDHPGIHMAGQCSWILDYTQGGPLLYHEANKVYQIKVVIK